MNLPGRMPPFGPTPAPAAPSLPLAAPTQLGQGPVPTEISVGQAVVQGNPVVVLQVVTPIGVAMYFLNADAAVQVGQQLARAGGAAGAGIVVAGAGGIT